MNNDIILKPGATTSAGEISVWDWQRIAKALEAQDGGTHTITALVVTPEGLKLAWERRLPTGQHIALRHWRQWAIAGDPPQYKHRPICSEVASPSTVYALREAQVNCPQCLKWMREHE